MKVFYHTDNDGMASGAIVLHRAIGVDVEQSGQTVDAIPIDYDKPFPFDDIKTDEELWIVDFSLKPDDMNRLLKVTRNIVWIDHHKTAMENTKDYDVDLPGVRDATEAACVLTWRYVVPDSPVPIPVALIGDRDAWLWKYGDASRWFYLATEVENLSPGSVFWEWALNVGHDWSDERLQKMLGTGRLFQKYRDHYFASYRKAMGFPVEFEGHSCFAMNAAKIDSECFGDKVQKDYDILISFAYTPAGKFTVSLYSSKVDVGEIAKKHGGGGHKGAAGFVCSWPPFLTFPKK